MAGTAAFLAGQRENVTVAVRVRPLSAVEAARGARMAVRCEGLSVNVDSAEAPSLVPAVAAPVAGEPKAPSVGFAYDIVLDDEAALQRGVSLDEMQGRAYQTVAVPCIKELMAGYNTTVFAYGQTGSGKTHTMLGDGGGGEGGGGIVPRLAVGLFEQLGASGHLLEDCSVEVTMLEIYQERVVDLLASAVNRGEAPQGVLLAPGTPHAAVWAQVQAASSKSNLARARVRSASSSLAFTQGASRARKQPSLAVREHPKHGPYVEGLTRVRARSWRELCAALEIGSSERRTGSTAMNDRSSRSHAVLTITLRRQIAEGGSVALGPDGRPFDSERVARCNLVDLAGSERQDRSGATGEKLRESSMINRSLTLLNDVIVSLSMQADFVPYRNSCLTWLLKESLGGNSKTIMVATISPAAEDARETVSTLRYAARAKRIRNAPVVNEDPRQARIRQLQTEVRALRKEVRRLKTQQRERTPRPALDELGNPESPKIIGRMAALEQRMKRITSLEANVRKARTWAYLFWQEMSSKGWVDGETLLAYIDDMEGDESMATSERCSSGTGGDDMAQEERRARQQRRSLDRRRQIVHRGLRVPNQQNIAAALDEGGMGHFSD